MKIRFRPAEIQWLKEITGTDNAQEALDFFVDCMKKERIDTSEIMTVITLLMEKKILPPGRGDK